MAKNTNPVFGLSGVAAVVSLTSASTPGDDTATVTNLITGDTNATRITNIQFISAQATVAGNSAMVCRLWLSIDSGVTWYKLREVAFAVVTGSNTAVGQFQEMVFPEGILLESSAYRLGVSKSVHAGVQDKLHVIARGTIQGA